MTEHIRTRWHHLRKIVQEDEVYITAPKGGRSTHWEDLLPSRDAFEFALDEFETLPRFVVDTDILEIVMKDKYQHSLVDMKRAGLMRLPFPAIVLEFQYGTGHHIVMLRDLAGDDFRPLPWEQGMDPEKMRLLANGHPIYGLVMRVEKDEHGEYVVLGPSHIGLDVDDRGGEPHIGLAGFALGIFEAKPHILNAITEQTWVKDGGAVFRALAAAMLVMHTDGVKKEVITCERINRTRIKSGKRAIPRHVVLSIGKVYRSERDETGEEYDKRRSPIPHWRRGHNRTVHFGKGRAQIRTRYINPRLVAFKDYDETPKAKTYQVQK